MLSSLSFISDSLPIIFFFLFILRNKEKELWVVVFYSLISFATDSYFYKGSPSKVTEYYLFSTFTIIEYTLFSIFFYLCYKSAKFKKLIIACSAIFLGFEVYNLLQSSRDRFDSLPASLESILIIAYSILFFYEELKSPDTNFIYSTKKFWVVIAIFVYLAATFILFISTFYMSDHERKEYWPINLIANIIKNVFICIAFALKPEKKFKTIQNQYNI